MEDRRGNTVQVDPAYGKVNKEKVLIVFDNASTITLHLQDLTEDGKINIVQTTNTSKVKGIGGAANAEAVEIILHTRNKERSIIVTAAIVDEIMVLPPKENDRFKHITQLSVNALNKEPKYGAVAESNFQKVLGGKIQILIGQSIGQEFFQEEISTLNCGLKMSRHRIQVYDESRYPGFSGRFSARFSPMYNEIEQTPKSIGNSGEAADSRA